jgi:hypothetical protein
VRVIMTYMVVENMVVEKIDMVVDSKRRPAGKRLMP